MAVKDLGFGIRFRDLVFIVFVDLKDFQDIGKHNNTKANPKTKILSQPIIFSIGKTLNYLNVRENVQNG